MYIQKPIAPTYEVDSYKIIIKEPEFNPIKLNFCKFCRTRKIEDEIIDFNIMMCVECYVDVLDIQKPI